MIALFTVVAVVNLEFKMNWKSIETVDVRFSDSKDIYRLHLIGYKINENEEIRRVLDFG